MMSIFSDMIEEFVEIFMDDFSIFGQSFESYLGQLESVLKRCTETNLVLSWEKSHFMVREGIVLGHVVSKKGFEVDRAKIMCDASNYAIGAVLGQRADKKPVVILYASKTFSEAQINYTTTEKELVAMVFALDKIWTPWCIKGDPRIDQDLGSTSGIRAYALRNFDLEVMEFETTQNNTTAKLPILKLGEYEMWEIRIKQYFPVQDYALWEVIENGNSWVSVPQTSQDTGTSVTKMSVLVTAEEKICKKNDVKARSLLLMALPNKHQLTFSQYTDAKTMFVAIKTRFGESFDSIFNRLQKLVSRLAILGVVITAEDLNSKFLRSLL
ncbi:ribonuclease H-like domain-containing protein [Tanacetum coccineum]